MMNTSASPPSAAPLTVRVWDRPTRLFHGLLIVCVATALGSGFLAPESWLDLHLYAGYGVIVLLLFRLAWGLYGSGPSRFSSFAFGPRAVLAHLRAVWRRDCAHAAWGHNPAGAVMIFALLLVLGGLAASGLGALGGTEKQGPLAGFVSFLAGRELREIHELLAFVLLALIAGHLAGVALESLLSRENLARAMITGRKRWRPGFPATITPARTGRATALFAGGLVVGGVVWAGLASVPPRGVPALPALPVYARECGDCHWAPHPSLLPAGSWHAMLEGMGEHFGENAALAPAAAAAIAAWLTTYAAEAWDTKASHVFRRVDPANPLRITATRFWKRKHEAIPPAVFASKEVGGPFNCNACHQDAESGRFSPQRIAPPRVVTAVAGRQSVSPPP